MTEEQHEFDVGPGDEMQKKHGLYAENWKPPELNPEKIPKELCHLIPLAKRWGITCDVTRHDAAAMATEDQLKELRDQLRGTHSAYEDWSYGQTEDDDG
jgi:hypothetical protein